MLVRVVLKAGGSGASCGDRRSGACFARISGVDHFGGSCGELVWAVFKGGRSGARRGDRGGRERAREERAVVLADLKCASFRRSPGVLVLEDLSGCFFRRVFERARGRFRRLGVACFGGSRGLLVSVGFFRRPRSRNSVAVLVAAHVPRCSSSERTLRFSGEADPRSLFCA